MKPNDSITIDLSFGSSNQRVYYRKMLKGSLEGLKEAIESTHLGNCVKIQSEFLSS